MTDDDAVPALRTHDLSSVPPEEIRFGVVMNGGVSLAVWMGGVALELDHLVKAHAAGTGPYATLLALTGCTARVDNRSVGRRARCSRATTTSSRS